MKTIENPDAAEALSAMADGEARPDEVARIASRWREDADLRAQWHGYQLIGDVMRSDELAGRAGQAQFLATLRASLAQEPAVLAPEPLRMAEVSGRVSPRRSSALRWRAPAAVAAGFVMVAGALVVMRPSVPVADEMLARTGAPVAVPQALVAAELARPAASTPGNLAKAPDAPLPLAAVAVAAPEGVPGPLVRDARMQQYFAAHQQFGGSTALGLPSAFLRNATFEAPAADAGRR